ncbi:DUF2625 family protein [bacterium]|nr:DUF2625 family protein [bacterium]
MSEETIELRQLDDLIEKNDPAWPELQKWIAEAKNPVEVLPANQADKESNLFDLQVTTKSILGAIIYETGGLLVDSGWIRILGSGSGEKQPRSITSWNREIHNTSIYEMPFHLVADDITGGFFACDAGALGNKGGIFYFAPDTLQWEDLEVRYPDFILWCMNSDLNTFYEGLRWEGWQGEVKALPGDRGMLYLPFPFAKPVSKEQAERPTEHKPVPMIELYDMYVNDFAKQLAKMVDGQVFEIRTE